jgi:CubicO group peptidase (beta-lactamase class C family)
MRAFAFAFIVAGSAVLGSASPALGRAWTLETAPRLLEEDQARIGAAIDEVLASGPSAGISVGVLHEDRVFTTARGFARQQPHVAATPRTSYRMASVTKTFTATAALLLAEDGKLDLDAEVQRYVPGFPRKPWPITVRQLLAHTSGIGHYKDSRDARFTRRLSVEEALAVFQNRHLVAEPGTRYVYSTFGYNLLGAVIEAAAEAPFETVLSQRIFAPLGMTRTSLEKGLDARDVDDAHGYRLTSAARGGRIVPSERMDISARFAGGGARSTVEDMLRFSTALIEGALLPAGPWATMTAPTVTLDGRQADYGLGVAVYPQRGLAVVAHAGGQWETSTLLFLVPERRLAIALATNLEGDAKRLSELAERVTEILLEGGRRRRELVGASPVDDVIYDGLNRFFSWGIARRMTPRLDADVDAAFAALPALFSRESIALAPEEARTRLREAFHPAFGRISPLVGGEIASALEGAYGPKDLERLRIEGPLAFFSSYLELCAREPCPPSRQLPPELALEIGRLSRPGALREKGRVPPPLAVTAMPASAP